MIRLLLLLKSALGALFWILLMLSFDDLSMTVDTLICALIHECGHILAITLILKRNFSLPHAVISGLRIKTRSQLSYREEIIAAVGGPAANIAFFLLTVFILPEFAVINLATAISNLLPLPDYDGGKILSDVIAIRSDSHTAERVLSSLSLIFSFALLFLSLFLILKMNGGYWIFFIFFAISLQQIFIFQKHTNYEK